MVFFFWIAWDLGWNRRGVEKDGEKNIPPGNFCPRRDTGGRSPEQGHSQDLYYVQSKERKKNGSSSGVSVKRVKQLFMERGSGQVRQAWK